MHPGVTSAPAAPSPNSELPAYLILIAAQWQCFNDDVFLNCRQEIHAGAVKRSIFGSSSILNQNSSFGMYLAQISGPASFGFRCFAKFDHQVDILSAMARSASV
ncbi:MAG: hypothetical protein C5B51_07765 [Terriglobia bacterium]|nr:MAG: hypothetical protein C5B51_07765 [Terriglobia bacterium]